jgi:hypothetical protein
MPVRVGINGFGRIGRNFFRAAKKAGADIDFVAVNDLGSVETMAHLLKYDSVLGRLDDDIEATGEGIKIGGDTLKVLAVRDRWGRLSPTGYRRCFPATQAPPPRLLSRHFCWSAAPRKPWRGPTACWRSPTRSPPGTH